MLGVVRRIVAVASVLWLCALPVAAQTFAVRVTLTDSASRERVRGAVVSLVTPAGAVVASGLTDIRGVRLLAAPDAGTYRLQVRRIGFHPYSSPPFALVDGPPFELALALASLPVALPAVQTTARDKGCARRGADSLTSDLLWEQIRIALDASRLTTEDSTLGTVRHLYASTIFGGGDEPTMVADAPSLAAHRPFIAVDPADIAAHGYAVSESPTQITYLGPDERVLLSPEFLDEHCFSAVAGSGATSGLIGLAFEPARGRELPEIGGTMWVNHKLALELVEFHYEGVPGNASGQIGFEQLADGRWIVREWRIASDYDLAVGSAEPYLAPEGIAQRAMVGGATSCSDSTTPALALVVAPASHIALDRHKSLMTVIDSEMLHHAGYSLVVIRWFDSVAVGGVRRQIGLPIAAFADSVGNARFCVPRRGATPFVSAYNGPRAATVPLLTIAADTGTPMTVIVAGDWPSLPPGLRNTINRRVRYVPEGKISLIGTVRDARGAPINGALVIVDGHPVLERTDKKGRFAVPSVAAGATIVDVWRPGYAPIRVLVDVTSKKREFDIVLGPSDGMK